MSGDRDDENDRATRRAVERTRAWLEHAVIGLNLCPFAKAPHAKGQIRCVATPTDDPRVLLELLCDEIRRLVDVDPAQCETTLLIHPNVLVDFDDYNDFLGAAEAALNDLGADGVLQIASFHPAYRFDGAQADDIANATNRSPHPMLHLLREASVDRAVDAFPDASSIYERNIATLDALGAAGWERLSERWR